MTDTVRERELVPQRVGMGHMGTTVAIRTSISSIRHSAGVRSSRVTRVSSPQSQWVSRASSNKQEQLAKGHWLSQCSISAKQCGTSVASV